jgi:hypothetical protein
MKNRTPKQKKHEGEMKIIWNGSNQILSSLLKKGTMEIRYRYWSHIS